MARKGENDTIAGKDFNPTPQTKVKGRTNINTDIENEIDALSLTERLKRGVVKDKKAYFRGYYLDEDVIGAIDLISEDQEKGYKSFAVNEILKEYFKRQGLL